MTSPQIRISRLDRVSAQGRRRYADRVRLDTSRRPPVQLDNGFLRIWGVATRVGVFEYQDDQGQPFFEYRPREEVLSPESLDTIKGASLTILHPDDFVDTRNAQDLVHGWIVGHEIEEKEEPLLWVEIIVSTEEAIKAVRSGLIELSMGYTAELEIGEGTSPAGEPYHATQTGIRYNHLALVDEARAGPVAKLKFDGKKIMKIKIKTDSKAQEVKLKGTKAKLIDALRGHLKDEAKGARKDTAVGKLTIEKEGEDPLELVLPMATLEMVMSSIGAEAPAEEPVQPSEPQDQLPPEEELKDQEGEGEEEEEKKEGEKVDRKAIKKLIADAVAIERKATRKEFADRAKAERDASRVLDASYPFEGKSTGQIKADAVAAVFEDRKDEASQLIRDGSDRALGKLDGLFEMAMAQRSDSQRSRSEVVDALFSGGMSRLDAACEKRAKGFGKRRKA